MPYVNNRGYNDCSIKVSVDWLLKGDCSIRVYRAVAPLLLKLLTLFSCFASQCPYKITILIDLCAILTKFSLIKELTMYERWLILHILLLCNVPRAILSSNFLGGSIMVRPEPGSVNLTVSSLHDYHV